MKSVEGESSSPCLIMDETMTDSTDQQLLEQFLSGNQPSTLEQILKRHGPRVKGVCLRVLENAHDADDACQAVFLVFARRAASVRNRQDLAGWFYRVAFHCAIRLKKTFVIRRERETVLQEEMMHSRSESTVAVWEEICPIMDEELAHLSEKYQTPLIHCYLEGLSYEELPSNLRERAMITTVLEWSSRAVLKKNKEAQNTLYEWLKAQPTGESKDSLIALLEAGLGTASLTNVEKLLANEITIFIDRIRIDVQTSTPGLKFGEAWNRRCRPRSRISGNEAAKECTA